MTKVALAVNDQELKDLGDFTLSEISVNGATGTATYRIDPLQDTFVKLVVKGEEADKTPMPQPVKAAAPEPEVSAKK